VLNKSGFFHYEYKAAMMPSLTNHIVLFTYLVLRYCWLGIKMSIQPVKMSAPSLLWEMQPNVKQAKILAPTWYPVAMGCSTLGNSRPYTPYSQRQSRRGSIGQL